MTVKRPTVTAALTAAKRDVTVLHDCGTYNSSYTRWSYSTYDQGYHAWIESNPTWFAAAVASRRLAMVCAAVDWACREFDLSIPSGNVMVTIEEGAWTDSVRDVLKSVLPHLIPNY
jgi:hypothetical protein